MATQIPQINKYIREMIATNGGSFDREAILAKSKEWMEKFPVEFNSVLNMIEAEGSHVGCDEMIDDSTPSVAYGSRFADDISSASVAYGSRYADDSTPSVAYGGYADDSTPSVAYCGYADDSTPSVAYGGYHGGYADDSTPSVAYCGYADDSTPSVAYGGYHGGYADDSTPSVAYGGGYADDSTPSVAYCSRPGVEPTPPVAYCSRPGVEPTPPVAPHHDVYSGNIMPDHMSSVADSPMGSDHIDSSPGGYSDDDFESCTPLQRTMSSYAPPRK
jgi:hypothetical protein